MAGDRRAPTRRRVTVYTACALAALGAAVLAALIVGPTPIDVAQLLRGAAAEADLRKMVHYRLPRALAAAIVGGALSLAGVLFQALIRNPLASPYVLGVSTGGSFAAVLALTLGVAWLTPAAFFGCCAAIGLVWALARRSGRVSSGMLLLAGVVVNAIFSAGISFVNILAAPQDHDRILRWLIGGLRDWYDPVTLQVAGGTIVAVALVVFVRGRELNLISVSDDLAERSGVGVGRLRTLLFGAGSLLTAVSVSISGPIAFDGLIVPHLLRLLVGPDHRFLVPLAIFGGGAFLVLVDLVAQSAFRMPIPAGVITAFLGGPFFLILLRRRDARRAGLDV